MPSRLLAAGLLVLVAATWKLWTPQDVFPQVPLIRAACDWPGWFDWVCLAVLVASSLTLLVVGQRGWWSRGSCIAMAVSLAGFFVLDQHRLQPWAWQFFLLAVLLSLADDTTARRGWRWLVIGIYFWSAVSKLDYTFCHEQGPALLGGLKQAMGLRGIPNRWTEALDVCGSLGIALGEMSAALLLAWPRTRWLGLWAATIMHLALLAALGPFGLNHSLGVLLWNVFFIVHDWLLFREAAASHPSSDETVLTQVRLWLRDVVTWPSSRPNRLALGAIAAAMAWPVLEPFGYCDHWMAWAVYSARTDQSQMPLSDENFLNNLPAAVRHHVIRSQIGWIKMLDLGGWSLETLNVPISPQNRFHLGVFMAVVNRQTFGSASLYLWGPRHRWTARTIYASGLRSREEVEAAADAYWWNARPRLVTFSEKKNPSP
ncbi:MAG: hypothetical protein AABP62_04145 [Planctomycetota bacterium]